MAQKAWQLKRPAKQPSLRTLDAELRMIATLGVPGIERFRRIVTRGDHEADVASLLQGFRLDDDSSRRVPASRLVARLCKEPCLFAGLLSLLYCLVTE